MYVFKDMSLCFLKRDRISWNLVSEFLKFLFKEFALCLNSID